MHGLEGFGDIELDLKYEFYAAKVGKGKLSLIGVGGFSTPLTIYENDFLASEASISRLMGDIHYRSDIETGMTVGKNVGDYVVLREQNDGGN